jgi:hypothetical protein
VATGKLLTREQFREAVFARDKRRCLVCGERALDAHHILERRLWPDGGYYLDNGASVCGIHHLEAERTTISCEFLRERAGIERVVLPPHFYPDTRYDKWGNPFVEGTERRYKGELYYDASVQKILDPGAGFVDYVKYPRTYHLPTSPGLNADDRRMEHLDHLLGHEVVVTEKMDGENCSMYRDHIHARSLDSRGSVDRDWVKNLWSGIRHEIPDRYRICGENLWAKHTVAYDDLPSYFLMFSLWDQNTCMSWDDTELWAGLLGLHLVSVCYRGVFEGQSFEDHLPPGAEGYIVRRADAFSLAQFRTHVGKWVRAGFVPEHGRHWRRGPYEQNGLRKN